MTRSSRKPVEGAGYAQKAALRFGLILGVVAVILAGCGRPAVDGEGPRVIRWGTSSVGSSGHRALVNLAAVLNREAAGVDITVLPMPGAVMTIRRYAAGEIDGFYGSDIAFHELAEDTARFAGFRERMQREPLQSFWAFTMEMGLAIRAADRENIVDWKSLNNRTLFTGPRPWDTRAHLERLLAELGMEFHYVDIDLGMAASQLATGSIDAIGIYATGGRDVAPWLSEAELSVNLAVLNPNRQEQDQLREGGFEIVSVDPGLFQTDMMADEILLSPFYYGFHLGDDYSEEEVYEILLIIEEHADSLASMDPVFSQVSENMAELQRRGVARAVQDVRVHPGLARYMRERGVWESEWDRRVADLN